MNLTQLFSEGDALSRSVASLLLLMSVASWVVILWKSWLLYRAGQDVPRGMAVFWQASSLEEGLAKLHALDRESVVWPLAAATQNLGLIWQIASTAPKAQQLTRALRNALHGVLRKLQLGQILLATVGATAPFVGLLGTVWGIYHALGSISASAQMSIDKIAGPVGESLLMTAGGLAVAIPAVIAYNVLGRQVNSIEAELEGFALDLREFLAGVPPPASDNFVEE